MENPNITQEMRINFLKQITNLEVVISRKQLEVDCSSITRSIRKDELKEKIIEKQEELATLKYIFDEFIGW